VNQPGCLQLPSPDHMAESDYEASILHPLPSPSFFCCLLANSPHNVRSNRPGLAAPRNEQRPVKVRTERAPAGGPPRPPRQLRLACDEVISMAAGLASSVGGPRKRALVAVDLRVFRSPVRQGTNQNDSYFRPNTALITSHF